jgi:RimJ/RimL family protein N-acetyltransferase
VTGPSAAQLTGAVPVLSAGDLTLGPWRDADAPAVLEMAADPATRAWSPSMRPLRTEADALAWLRQRSTPERCDWAVRDAATGRVVGRTGLHRFDDDSRSAEIGYGVHPAHRRRGVARRGVEAVTDFGFQALGLARVSLIHAVGNGASCAVASSAGYWFEGIERAALDHGDGVLHDVHRHARLATDPPGRVDAAPPALDVPVIESDGIRLRPWRDDDAAAYLRGLTDPAAARWNPSPAPATENDARRFLTRLRQRAGQGSTVAWAIEEDGAVAGSIGLRGVNLVDRWVNASYWVLPEARGRGVATRALTTATTYAFERLDLHRVQLQHALANTASCRVAERAGFALEATLRESCLLAEGFVDEHQHVRIRQP